MSTLAQTYLLASKVKAKLTKEAVNPNANLRVLVCQANLLDNLMDSLQNKRPIPNFPPIKISSVKIEEEDEEDSFTSSSDDDEDDYYYEEEEDETEQQSQWRSTTTIGRSNSRSNVISTTITSQEFGYDSDSDEYDSDLEDYEVSQYTYTKTLVDSDDEEYDSNSSVSSDEEVEVEVFDHFDASMDGENDEDEITPSSSPDDDLFISLSNLNNCTDKDGFKLVSSQPAESDLPPLSDCSSISSDDELLDEEDLSLSASRTGDKASSSNSDENASNSSHYNIQHKATSALDLVSPSTAFVV